MAVGLALAFVVLALVLDPVISLDYKDITISSSGVIRAGRGCIITGNASTSTYAGINSNTGQTTSGPNAVTVINTVIGWMSPGQNLELIGTFSIGSTVSVPSTKTGISVNATQATLTLTANTYLLRVSASNVQILNGHWKSDVIGVSVYGILFAECSNCVVDGGTFYGFGAPTTHAYALWAAYGTDQITFQNCHVTGIHGTVCGGVLLNAGNYHKILNCTFTEVDTGVFMDHISGHNLIADCEFTRWHQLEVGHAVYMDGGADSVGYNEVTNCNFHDPNAFCGIQCKCQNNRIHDNTFTNFPQGSLPLHIYSQYSGATANDNEIYNNTINDAYIAVMMGNADDASPTLGNKFYDNTFNNCTHCFWLNAGDPSSQTVEDTWIYYNTFTNCGRIFPQSPSPTSTIRNTVIAYNTFDAQVPSADVAALRSYVNTMIYGNEPWLLDFNVPAVKQIPPR